jgi:hypothetical protein
MYISGQLHAVSYLSTGKEPPVHYKGEDESESLAVISVF